MIDICNQTQAIFFLKMLPYFALSLSYTRIFIPLVTVCTDGAFTVGVRRKKERFPLPGDKILVKYSLMQFGLNEADTLKSISILIYSISEQSIFVLVLPME